MRDEWSHSPQGKRYCVRSLSSLLHVIGNGDPGRNVDAVRLESQRLLLHRRKLCRRRAATTRGILARPICATTSPVRAGLRNADAVLPTASR
jgi:hypothetical protein